MRRLILILILLLAGLASYSFGQSGETRANTIKRPCAGSSTPAKVTVERDGDINLVPCSGRDVLVGGNPIGGAGSTQATTTEVQQGTNTTKFVSADSLAALWEQGSNVASAATVSLGEGGYFVITGTTGISDIDFATDKAGRRAWVRFSGILTLTHSANLILPTSANITTAAGDTAEIISEGTDVIRVVSYQRASGAALVGGGGSLTDGDKGDITVSGSGATWTIDNGSVTGAKIADGTIQTGDIAAGGVSTTNILDGSVTLAKIENINGNTVLGNSSGVGAPVEEISVGASQLVGRGSTGNVTAITLGSNLSMSGTTLNATGGGAATAGGSNTQCQYNNATALGGISGCTSDGTNTTFSAGALRTTGPRVTTSINDANGNESIRVDATASAVNDVTVTNSATGNAPTIAASGDDTNIDLVLSGKGTGGVRVASSGTSRVGIGDTNNSHYLNLVVGSDLTADRNLTITTGDAARNLTINGDAVLVAGTMAASVTNSTATLGTSAIASGACATTVTVAATGVVSTDTIMWVFNADPTSTTGYNPATGVLTIYAFPTAGNVNFKVCNLTASSITPGAVTLNWRVLR